MKKSFSVVMLAVIVSVLLSALTLEAQVSPGTINAKLQDGSGNKITSTANALDVNIKSSGVVLTTTTGGVGTFGSAQQAVTATAVALATNSSKQVCVKALTGNILAVFIGTTGVTTSTGMELAAGDSQCLALNNTNLIFVVASSTGSSVSYDWIN